MLAHARSEEIQEYGHSRFYFCPVCQAVFTPNDFGVETVMGRAFHVVHFTTDEGEAWERHPLRPIAQGPVPTQPK